MPPKNSKPQNKNKKPEPVPVEEEEIEPPESEEWVNPFLEIFGTVTEEDLPDYIKAWDAYACYALNGIMMNLAWVQTNGTDSVGKAASAIADTMLLARLDRLAELYSDCLLYTSPSPRDS